MRASEIEEVLRTDVAEPSPAFAAELDRRVAEGFPKPARRRRAWLRPAIAGAAVLIGVAVVAVSLVGNGGPRRSAPVPLSQDRLGNALVERRTLKLRRQTRATRARIAELNATIVALSARLRTLRSRTSYSTVTVTLEQAKTKHAGGTGAAFDDARRILEGIL